MSKGTERFEYAADTRLSINKTDITPFVTMFDFIVPLRARSTTEDWSGVCKVLEHTLASLCNTPGEDYRVIVVYHDRPTIAALDARVLMLPVGFEAPPPESWMLESPERTKLWETDKCRKILTGLARTRADGSRYVMPFDADDFVSSRLVGFCLSADHPAGYFIDAGYRIDDDTPGWVFPRRRFFEECGSSNILRTELAPFPDDGHTVLEFESHFIRRYVLHAYMPEYMERIGQPLMAVPFPGAAYRFHRNNMYANRMRRPDGLLRKIGRQLLKGKRIDTALSTEFGFETA